MNKSTTEIAYEFLSSNERVMEFFRKETQEEGRNLYDVIKDFLHTEKPGINGFYGKLIEHGIKTIDYVQLTCMIMENL